MCVCARARALKRKKPGQPMPCKVPWKTSTATNRSVDAMPSPLLCMGTQARRGEALLTERKELWLSREPGYRKQNYQCYRILASAEHQRRDYGTLRCQETRRGTWRTGKDDTSCESVVGVGIRPGKCCTKTFRDSAPICIWCV